MSQDITTAYPFGKQIRGIREREGPAIAVQLVDLHVTTTLLVGHVYHGETSEALADVALLAKRLENIRDLIVIRGVITESRP